MLRRQHPGQCVLRVVGVLIFIDQNITKPLLIFFQYCRELFQQPDGYIHQIIKIHRIIRQQLLLIQTVHRRHPLLIIIVGLGRKPFRRYQLILGVGYGPDHTADRKLPLRQIQLFQALTDQQLDVRFIVNREMPAVPTGHVHFHPQESGAKRMKRTQPDVRRHRPDQSLHPLLHFCRRFVGESDGQYLPGLDPLFNQVSDPAGQHAGLA